jgi:hypothetical protein
MGSLRDRDKPIGSTRVMSRTLVVIAVVLALLVIFQAVQPSGIERAQTTFREISAWVQKWF